MQVRLEKDNRVLNLNARPLGHGGEAIIYPVGPFAAKVYHRPTAAHAAKLAAMIAHPPKDPMAEHAHTSITWPVDRLLKVGGAGGVVGYVMPRIDNVLPMAEFFNPKARLAHCPLFHFAYLLRTAHNLCAAVRAIHEAGYVVGDLNECNCLVNNQALVTLVDTDSFQVPDSGKIFRCPVGKPEYTAPELQGVRFSDVDRFPEHDNFALAILIFQLLMQGIHPFAGKFTGTGEPASLPERISAGHWPYSTNGNVAYGPNPHAPPLDVLPTPVRALLHLCFEAGHKQGKRRPAAKCWQEALQDGEKELVPCTANSQHLYPRTLCRCPWCDLAQRQGRDPFPSTQAVRTGRFGLRRLLAKLRKPRPMPPARPAGAFPSPVTTLPRQSKRANPALLPPAFLVGSLGPLQAPPLARPAMSFVSFVLFGASIAALGATVSGVIIACTDYPWHAGRARTPSLNSPFLGLIIGALIGGILGYLVGALFEENDVAVQTDSGAGPKAVGTVMGGLFGGLGGLWGHMVAVHDSALLAGSLGKDLGVIGLAALGSAVGGLVGGLVLGMLVRGLTALARGR
jgi:DNA-binding helix-hairpin-helix protein with protein kinase domain